MCGLLVPADPGGGKILCLIKKNCMDLLCLELAFKLSSTKCGNKWTKPGTAAQQHSTPGTHSGASVGESHEFERVQDELGQHSQKKKFFFKFRRSG